jgi:hypothetical protein
VTAGVLAGVGGVTAGVLSGRRRRDRGRPCRAVVDVTASVLADGENTAMNLARIGWLTMVIASLIAVLVLALQGYYGYAGVTLAVAASAAINLT